MVVDLNVGGDRSPRAARSIGITVGVVLLSLFPAAVDFDPLIVAFPSSGGFADVPLELQRQWDKAFRGGGRDIRGEDVVYTALEAPNVRTVISDVTTLEDGKAVIDLPKHFGMVTDPDESLIVDITPYSTDSKALAVTERSVDRIVVEELGDGTGTYEFAYTVKGTRKGYADKEVVREHDERLFRDSEEKITQLKAASEEAGQPSESPDGSC